MPPSVAALGDINLSDATGLYSVSDTVPQYVLTISN